MGSQEDTAGHHKSTAVSNIQPSVAPEEVHVLISKAQHPSPGYKEPPNPTKNQLGSFWTRTVTKLGRFQLAVLVGGDIGLLGAVALLWYLWPWKSRGETYSTWQAIVFSDWIFRVITLTSIVVRVSMAMQATVFCMVMASITLQRGGVLLQDVAAVSIFRFSNSGPHNMFFPLFRAHKGWKSDLGIVVTGLLSITTIASQFTSTILLTDIGTRDLRTVATTFNVSFGGDGAVMNEFWVSSTANSWDNRPSTLPVFAEKATKNIKLDGHKNGGALFATGNSLRALFPLGKQQRISLAEYEGPAAVVDSRVVCVSPYIERLSFNITPSYFHEDDSGTYQELYIHGEGYPNPLSDYSDELESLGFLTTKLGNLTNKITFDCKTPGYTNSAEKEPFNEWKVAFCKLDGVYLMSSDNGTDFFGGSLNLGFVVMNMTGVEELWYNSTTVDENNIGFGNRSDGEWTKISYPSPNTTKSSSLDLSISFCFTSFNAINAKVIARAEWNLTEPVLSKSTDSPRYNTTEIRTYLGVKTGETTDLETSDRGILELTDVDHKSVSTLPTSQTWIRQSLIDSKLNPGAYVAPTARMCIWCAVDIRIHEGYIAIFEDTIAATTHPALALQALLTSRALKIYEDRRPDLSISDVATMSLFEPFQVPTTFKGLYVVLALICFHLLLMMYIVILFFKIDDQTSLGQAWQTVAQLQGEETKEVMAVATAVTDRKVKKWLAERGERKSRVGIRGGKVIKRTRSSKTELGSYLESGGRSSPVRRSISSFGSSKGIVD